MLAGWHLRKRRRASLPAPSDTGVRKYYLDYIHLHIQVCVYKRAGVDSGGRDGSVPPPRNPALRAAAGPRRPPRPRCSRAPLGAEPARGCPQPGHRHGAVPGAGAVPGPPLGFVFRRFTGARCDEAAPGGLRRPPGRGTAGGGPGAWMRLGRARVSCVGVRVFTGACAGPCVPQDERDHPCACIGVSAPGGARGEGVHLRVHGCPGTPGWVRAHGGHGCARRCAPGVRRLRGGRVPPAPGRGCPAVAGRAERVPCPGQSRPGPAPGGRTGGTWSRTSAPRPGLCPAAPPSRGPALSGPGGSLPGRGAEPRPGRSRDPVTARDGGGRARFYPRAAANFPLCQRGPGAQPRREGPAAPNLPPPLPLPGHVGFNPGGRGGTAAPPQPCPSGVTPGAPSPPRRGGPAAAAGWVRGGPGEQTGRPPGTAAAVANGAAPPGGDPCPGPTPGLSQPRRWGFVPAGRPVPPPALPRPPAIPPPPALPQL